MRHSLQVLGFGSALLASAPAQTPEPSVAGCMRELAEAVRSAQARVERGDAAGVAADAARLVPLVADLPALVRAPDDALVADVRWHADRVRQRAGTLAASGLDLAAQREGLAHLCRACTACHVEFRVRGEGGVPWPAAGEAIAGRVQVRSLDGGARDDLRKVVVFLEGVPRAEGLPALRPKIVQKDKSFVPDLLVITAGMTVEFPNHDAVFHNVFSLAIQQKFDLGLYGGGETRSVAFTQPGLVKIYCNIHPEMVAHVLVLRGPDATTVAPSGFFALVDLPRGKFTLRTWSEFGGDLTREVEVPGGEGPPLLLEMQETRRRVPHANKFGHPYREKY